MLSELQIEDLNRLATFLAAEETPPPAADVIIAVGGALVDILAQAVSLYRAGRAPKILVCGGVGHSTRLLWANVAADMPGIPTEGRAEADIYRDVLVSHFGVPEADVIVENESTNCGANAVKTREVLDGLNFAGSRFVIIQDPTMQIRTIASFQKAYEDRGVMEFFSVPPFVPVVTTKGIEGGKYRTWTMERFVELVLGEIPRLSAYGPSGSGFIAHVDVPGDVVDAWSRLREAFPEQVRA
jgi:uncharacterized SAM-binding protein YcdF (DUF218 family)